MRGMHSSTSHFQKFFVVYNFSLTSSLFNSNNPNVLGTHNRKYTNKMHRNRRSTQKGQKIKQNLPEKF